MIWALLAAYFLSGGSGGSGGINGSVLTTANVKQLREHAAAVLEDSDRSEAVQQILKELGNEATVFEKLYAKSGKELTNSYRNHADESEQTLAVIDDLNSGWEASQQRALDLRFELRDSMTEAEWTALFGGE